MKQRSMKIVYIAAAFISLVLYSAGIFTGIFIQKSISDSVESDLANIKKDIETQQQQLLLLKLQGEESCVVLKSLSSITAGKLQEISGEIRRLEAMGSKDERFSNMKETYSTLSIQAWIVMSAISKNCEPMVVPILYYYSFPCEQCDQQELVLDQLKAGDSDRILTYAVDKDVNNSLVQILVESHNIQTAPSIVYGDEIYLGYISAQDLAARLCEQTNLTCSGNKLNGTAD